MVRSKFCNLGLRVLQGRRDYNPSTRGCLKHKIRLTNERRDRLHHQLKKIIPLSHWSRILASNIRQPTNHDQCIRVYSTMWTLLIFNSIGANPLLVVMEAYKRYME